MVIYPVDSVIQPLNNRGQARSVLYAYTHVRTWSDQKILKFLAIVSIFNLLWTQPRFRDENTTLIEF